MSADSITSRKSIKTKNKEKDSIVLKQTTYQLDFLHTDLIMSEVGSGKKQSG